VLILGCVGWSGDAGSLAMHVKLLESKLTVAAVVDSSILGQAPLASNQLLPWLCSGYLLTDGLRSQPDVAAKLATASAVIALEFSAVGLLDNSGAPAMRLLQVGNLVQID